MVQAAAENTDDESTVKADLCDRSDVIRLVSTFYQRAFADPLLGPVFLDVARMDLEKHMPIMADFWETVLFQAGLYRRNALAVHLDLNAKVELTAGHFDRWLELWTRTVDDLYVGGKAELAKLQAGRIAGSIHRRVRGKSPSDLTTISTIRPTVSTTKAGPDDSLPSAPGYAG
ncbi:group III truncated hemoglobin [Arthrobacter terrae]|uniref:group III truncated hemoglobin n=1 Tax=Arthrobacter terrae TaxID=2935737 RepID=UPI001E5285C6|nr:group III truncated hemoglobin [Arthrobacter terrae]